MLKSSDTLADIDSSIDSFGCHKFVSSTPFRAAATTSEEQLIILKVNILEGKKCKMKVNRVCLEIARFFAKNEVF